MYPAAELHGRRLVVDSPVAEVGGARLGGESHHYAVPVEGEIAGDSVGFGPLNQVWEQEGVPVIAENQVRVCLADCVRQS